MQNSAVHNISDGKVHDRLDKVDDEPVQPALRRIREAENAVHKGVDRLPIGQNRPIRMTIMCVLRQGIRPRSRRL